MAEDKLSLEILDLREILDIHSIFRRAIIKILIVVDTQISIGDLEGFGVGRIVRLLRNTNVGCSKFRVDIAIRNSLAFSDNPNAAISEARYQGFRYNSVHADGSSVISDYHEIFFFGFQPGNNGAPDDTDVEDPDSLPASDIELRVLRDWMNAGGGVFATGDHHYLGASMCYRIPRVGTMRKWTNLDGVPTIGGNTRIDTNQPATPGQEAGTDVIPNSAERDEFPQPIEWVPDSIFRNGFLTIKRPHPVLCHPEHGPIDVMPDHPHEGCCFEPADIDIAERLDFGDGQQDEYPSHNGSRPEPKIIAYGNTVPDPPFDHQKGEQPPLRFPMISVYDGHKAEIGRVVVDSTWHHWFNLNLDGIETNGDPVHWDKISRYFINIAVWLAEEGVYREHCWWEILRSQLIYPGLELQNSKLDYLERGKILQRHLRATWGPCAVFEFVYINICDIAPNICRLYEIPPLKPSPLPDPCWSCPPWEFIEVAFLGGLVEGTTKYAERTRKAIYAGKKQKYKFHAGDIEKAALRGAAKSLRLASRDIRKSAQRTLKAFG